MQYTVAHICFDSVGDVERDLTLQTLADIGFEAFDGDDAYIQSALLDRELLSRTLLLPYRLEDCPDEDWNATWEAEHPAIDLPLGIRIVPHCAFGAGHHETTSMIIGELIRRYPDGSIPDRILDMGCGTGVLGIMAAQLGAKEVLCVDIDDHSTTNTLENAALNGLHVNVLTQGTVPDGTFDLILANIHRNILLAQMADYARCLTTDGEVWLSGFYEADIASLQEAASLVGLKTIATHHNGEWRLMILRKIG